jgi:hypothetical protein
MGGVRLRLGLCELKLSPRGCVLGLGIQCWPWCFRAGAWDWQAGGWALEVRHFALNRIMIFKIQNSNLKIKQEVLERCDSSSFPT